MLQPPQQESRLRRGNGRSQRRSAQMRAASGWSAWMDSSGVHPFVLGANEKAHVQVRGPLRNEAAIPGSLALVSCRTVRTHPHGKWMSTGQGRPTALVEEDHERDLNTNTAPPSSPMGKGLKAESARKPWKSRPVFAVRTSAWGSDRPAGKAVIPGTHRLTAGERVRTLSSMLSPEYSSCRTACCRSHNAKLTGLATDLFKGCTA